jgi:hypothetical protein
MDLFGSHYPENRRNRCATCGFLSLRVPHFGDTKPPVEVLRENRDSGELFNFHGGSAQPRCFIDAADPRLFDEIQSEAASSSNEHYRQQAQLVINRERDGSAWFPWQPGFSPKEHLEKYQMLQLEQARRESDERLAASNAVIAQSLARSMELTAQAAQANAAALASSERIQKDSLDVAKESKDVSKESHDYAVRWTRVFVLFAVLSFVIALLTLLAQVFYPNGIAVPTVTL